MNYFVFGAGGMLGKAVTLELLKREQPVRAFTHREVDIALTTEVTDLDLRMGDLIINCAGVRAHTGRSATEMVLANAVGPHVLADACRRSGALLYHISTDCVFSALRWDREPSMNTIHTSPCPAPDDLYGRSKLAGEVSGPGCTTIRTSFVGPEHGLWQWLADQPKDATVEAWYKAHWSGSTVWEVAEKIVDIVISRAHDPLIHLATPEPITKAQAVSAIICNIDRQDIVLVPGGPRVDRSMTPTHELRPLLEALARWSE